METEGKERKKNKGEKTKQKLYDCAVQLFSEYGFDDVNVDTITEAAGVSKGTFYIYFESKDALIALFLSNYVNSVDAQYQVYLDSLPVGMTASDRILSLIAKITDVLTETIGCRRMQIAYKVQLAGTTDMLVVMGYHRKLYHMFADVLAQGIERGEFKTELALDALTKHFVMAIRALTFEWCIRYPDFDLKQQSLEHFKLLLNGIVMDR